MRKHLIIFLLFALAACKAKIDTQPLPSKAVVVDDTVVVIPLESLPPIEENKIEEIINPEPPAKDSILSAIYLSQVGVREATGNNDGKEVEMYLKSTGLGKGYAWCAAFVKWCFDSAQIKTTITAWSPSAENKSNYVFKAGEWKRELKRGDVFTIYFPRLKRIGHTGFCHKKFGLNSIQTVEGNTNMQGSREGDGVYIKIRPKETIFSITRWF